MAQVKLAPVTQLQPGGVTGLMQGQPWVPIEDVENDKHAQDLGRFAVEEQNKRVHSQLRFDKVVYGWTQSNKGTMYKLQLQADDRGDLNMYEAVVWEKATTGAKVLLSFMPLG